MKKSEVLAIQITQAKENNLKSIDVTISLNSFVVVTGVSGSGKSSLAFDVIVKEAQRRYLESIPSFARLYAGKISTPDVDDIQNLPPVISLSQKAVGGGSRSTLGTMSDLYSYLRLLFARLGTSDRNIKISRSLFSFNSPLGACPQCGGLGLQERISIDKLIAHPEKSVRNGAIVTTLPTGYIMYTQLTMESMQMLCNAHGFSVDIPWCQLTDEQKNIVLYGSNKIKVPVGKHTLESRLKWEGIAAKPPEEDYYKGIINIMSDILRRDRNPNILKYTESVKCNACGGSRLCSDALSVKIQGKNITEVSNLSLSAFHIWLQSLKWSASQQSIATPIIDKMVSQLDMFYHLGMGHLSLATPTTELSLGDTRRVRLINQMVSQLSGVLYVFDEAFVGLHPHDHAYLVKLMRQLVNNGNTVLLVEHDENTIRQADYIIDIGPEAGQNGGEILFQGTINNFLDNSELSNVSATHQALTQTLLLPSRTDTTGSFIGFDNGLKIAKGGLNVVTGLSNSGKQHLILNQILPIVTEAIDSNSTMLPNCDDIKNIFTVSRKPIGRTPRSNPSTYTGLSNALRDVFAASPQAKEKGFKKSHFSFNTKGGRCEHCQGAGKIQIGMHFIGNVDLVCPVCNGKRFRSEILDVFVDEKTIADVYDMTVSEAIQFFTHYPKVLVYLKALNSVGLSYLSLGQSSTSLSGGEAQRVKFASYLKQSSKSKSIFIFDEPSNGLHPKDINTLLSALYQLCDNGHTLVCLSDTPHFIQAAHHVIELQAKTSNQSNIVYQGSPDNLPTSNTYAERILNNDFIVKSDDFKAKHHTKISLRNVTTHNLKSINVDFPKNKITAVTGVSGSGKSSLVYDSLVAESNTRFHDSMGAYARTFLKQSGKAQIGSCSGINPVVAITSDNLDSTTRSTVGTLTGVNDYLRLLFSRLSHIQGLNYSARHFSFNHQLGACAHCNGLGVSLVCNPDALVFNPKVSISEGALCGNSTSKYFGNPHGQFVAILSAAAAKHNVDIYKPFSRLSSKAVNLILYGCGDEKFDVTWEYRTKTKSGFQQMQSTWPGFCFYIEDEYRRKHQNKTADKIRELMHEVDCPQCGGARLNTDVLDIRLASYNISQLCQLPISKLRNELHTILHSNYRSDVLALLQSTLPPIITLLDKLVQLRIGYLSLNRSTRSLSGGELQRVRLARAFASPMQGVTYVIDEPSRALHPDDMIPIIDSLKELKQNGNTIIIVEHSYQMMEAVDFILELGPEAGSEGGQVIASGDINSFQFISSPTADYLNQSISIQPINTPIVEHAFGVRGASANNLKNIDVDFISNGMIALTGVSGSGKSSLVRDVIKKSLSVGGSINCTEIYGFHRFDNIHFVSQKSLTYSSFSSVASILGILDDFRNIYSSLPISKSLGLKKSAFSYTHKDGKCPYCNGLGVKKVSMDFMSDVEMDCEYCEGLRYKDEILNIRYHDKNIGELLQFRISDIDDKFVNENILRKIEMLSQLRLSHLQLGQSISSLSSGEKQRIKLITDLWNSSNQSNLYIFDEPAAGLHHHDIIALIDLFNQLIQSGHTILYIDHREELISAAHQVITLGPSAGYDGGYLC